jgi:poly-beta-1,6-N-acetyl-D-glucosamine synthase
MRPARAAARYVVITPARDEAQHIGHTIGSVVRQSVRPAQWIIVDDGSKDATGTIIDEAAKEHAWITSLKLPNRGFRQPGAGVIETFYCGYEHLTVHDWEFIVKLDADLGLTADYFRSCFEEFYKDPKLGITGGQCYVETDGKRAFETHPLFHVRGPTKIYRRPCWEAIGGLAKTTGWDSIDELKANMLGWRTRTLPELHVHHRRSTGAVDGSWRDSVKCGRANYITGYHPAFVIAKCLRRFFRRPFLVGSAGIFYGFLSGYFGAAGQTTDKDLIRYVRKEQLRRLLLQNSIWK